jgi:cytochrome c
MRLPLAVVVGSIAGASSAAALAAGGEAPTAYTACAACHAPAGGHGTGPSLSGVLGRRAGTLAGFRYSRAMRGSGITWDAESLDRYIANPQKVVPGNRMPFAGLEDPGQRAAIVQYLRTLR